MKVLVPVKRVIDYNVRPRVKADQSGVDLANVKMAMNPFDEISIEEAVRMKEKGLATEIVVVDLIMMKNLAIITGTRFRRKSKVKYR